MNLLESAAAVIILVGADGGGLLAPLAIESAVFVDELSRVGPIVHRARYGFALHANAQIVTNFKVQMRCVHAAIGAECAHLLTSLDELANFDHAIFEVSIERVAKFHLSRLRIAVGMAENDDVAPADPHVIGKGHDAISCGVNGIAHVGITAVIAIPVLAEVNGRAQSQTASHVVTSSIRFAHWAVKSIGQRNSHSALLRHEWRNDRETQEERKNPALDGVRAIHARHSGNFWQRDQGKCDALRAVVGVGVACNPSFVIMPFQTKTPTMRAATMRYQPKISRPWRWR